MAVIIDSVSEGSSAYRAGIKAGDTLLKINGFDIVDVLDYRFCQVERDLDVEYISSEETKTVHIRKSEYEELGLEFATYLMDKEHSCRNKCIFCFIDQLPKGMRESLYFKDDDSRLSFLFGNYITLTNLTDHEVERIIRMHISPVNISVHTTNPELRCKMMNNRFAGQSLDIMRRFAENGIVINCQLVLCKGINDGDELRRSLEDLTAMGVNAVALVPVGLTDHREGLFPLEPFDEHSSAEVLCIAEEFGEKCLKSSGSRVVYASDEFYIKAGRKIPEADFYEDFACLENGVGLIALQEDEFTYALDEKEADASLKRKKTVACGVSIAPYLKALISRLKDKFPKVQVSVVPIINDFFGHMINVSGLIVGQDLINQLSNKDLGTEVLITSCMLRAGEEVFLDDVTLSEASERLKTPVTPVENSGEALLEAILR
ncbi:MAG: DUF512 domain-containing protein [Ruminococcus sp.]